MRLAFEGFEVDLDAGQLIVAGEAVALERRAFEMLAYLALHPNRLVSKDEPTAEVWQARVLRCDARALCDLGLLRFLAEIYGELAQLS